MHAMMMLSIRNLLGLPGACSNTNLPICLSHIYATAMITLTAKTLIAIPSRSEN